LSPGSVVAGLRSRRALGATALVAALLLLLALIGGLGPGGATRASGQSSAGEAPTPQTDASVPARGVIMLGSSPGEAPNETWGIGEVGSQSRPSWALVRYASDSGWSLAAAPVDAAGHPLSGFEPARSSAAHSVLGGALTTAGSGALLGTVPDTPHERKVLLVRSPGGAFQETPPVPAEGEAALLKVGESLYSEQRAPLVAAIDEGGKAGALVVPVNASAVGVEDGVLHWDGSHWKREPIEIPAKSKAEGGFRVLGLGASSAGNAWLLAQLSSGSGAVALFRRHPGESEEATWKPVAVGGEKAGEPLTVNGKPFTVLGTGEPPTATAQVLTVTAEGVWIDGLRADVQVPATAYFKPEGEGEGGSVKATWCNVPGGATPCDNALPESLPTQAHRSFAWADPSAPFGQRVITGLPEGVSLRLAGSEFSRVLALGGSEVEDVGASDGAAFSSPQEGWLGSASLPVHLTRNPLPSRLTPYPVPFRRTLVAVAPQPGAPVGALSSQALAVGDLGEVTRYVPGQGWMPESLIGAGGKHATPRLRAVAWPTPSRAYAVGERGEMWLWRGETGLWEQDPATPANLRGHLLGIAFDPGNPSRGYAVGQQGVLLRFGKSWTQEALPPEAAGASFTSIAFAGSEAMVAFRLLHPQRGNEGAHYTGGLLVNSGSGWHVEPGVAAGLGSEPPWAVAGLPDGGAAVSAGGPGETPMVLERNGFGGPWQPTAAPYPGFDGPGALALFREGGGLRTIGSGGIPDTLKVDNQIAPPAGFPPNLIAPYPLATGHVLRQTAGGWSDEEHDRNEVGAPAGNYVAYDTVFQPDPTSAVLVDQTGSQGWAVGGVFDPQEGRADTADIERYPADGAPPPGFAAAPVQTSAAEATFAIGGNAQCAAPCAGRANAGLGPDVWLSTAVQHAMQIAGVRAFLYTGPRVTTGQTSGSATRTIAYAAEYERYAAVLGSGSLPAFAAPSPTDRGGATNSECAFEAAFTGFPVPFGGAEAGSNPELRPSRSAEGCGPSAQALYYAFDSTGSGGTVRVIVLDDSSEVGATQITWLTAQLEDARSRGVPAIVVGNADLNAQIDAQQPGAQAVGRALAGGGAAAYFYDSPQLNVQAPLRGSSVPTFGSGTLGYISQIASERQDFSGASGFLLVHVNGAVRDPATKLPQVSVQLIPNIGELAMEAQDGVLLRRSSSALFAGLARRPRSGGVAQGQQTRNESATYIPIPENCIGASCGILPTYAFSSSRPDIGNFVKPNLAVPGGHSVLLDANEQAIADPTSGLFCAFNAGTTVVTISSGGLSASLAVTVQAGSVRRPCGTVPLKEVASIAQVGAVPPAPAPGPGPAAASPSLAPTLIPLPVPLPPPVVTPPAAAKPAAIPPFLAPPAPVSPVPAFVPPPVPTPARPTPPSGTSAVTSPIEVAEHEEEEEEATESVSNQAVAYHPHEHEPSPVFLLGLIVLAAFAGSTIKRRRGRRGVRVAPATISAMRQQRSMSEHLRRRYR
jgi:hypothetical protein